VFVGATVCSIAVRSLIALIVLAAVLAGCGSSDEKQARATIAAELRALESEDWNAVCELRTAAGRREFLRASLRPNAQSCAAAWTPAPGSNEPILVIKFKRPTRRLSGVDVKGVVATARYDDGSGQRLRKIGGRWLIDGTL
jgi:hypothetical protein